MPDDAAVCLRPVRVVIVDDTRTVRAMIRSLLSASNQIDVVGEAGDPYEARELIRELNPDVITLDVVMPKMSGLSFLEKLMRLRPMPVVMVSTRTTERSREAITALSLGAVDCIDLGQLRRSNGQIDLAETVLMAAASNVGGINTPRARRTSATGTEQSLNWNGKVVVIGSSTGGVDALLRVLADYPADCPPTVIAQHMPAAFLESFARRLDKNCLPHVSLAESRARLEQGQVYLAPGGDLHTRISKSDRLRLENVESDGSEPYVPAVNQLFSSAEPHAATTVGVMLTGMGRDGADAMLRMRAAGAHTIVQDGASAVIDGMPRAARELGAAAEVAPLATIGQRILANVTRSPEEASG
ncbi:MAG: chemotaxis-specific protein-glutamate methyltransferase CheB [Paracoccaceae bacterium]|nr:chemotaxis-specific protein-glutamate methyltransferase CheB [Paracoccaceae bacterium]